MLRMYAKICGLPSHFSILIECKITLLLPIIPSFQAAIDCTAADKLQPILLDRSGWGHGLHVLSSQRHLFGRADAPLVRRLNTAMTDENAAEDNEGMKKTWESFVLPRRKDSRERLQAQNSHIYIYIYIHTGYCTLRSSTSPIILEKTYLLT